MAGRRRFHAATIVAKETGDSAPMPCAILDDGDDAAALEASLIENIARRDPDDGTQWETFTALVKQGKGIEDLPPHHASKRGVETIIGDRLRSLQRL